MNEPHTIKVAQSLQRFVDAQAACFTRVREELRAGQKRSHWMWFIFPQIHGLGSSAMAQRYAIADYEEAAAYLDHPTLGPRLRECTALVNAVTNRTIEQIFGYPDDLKFHSSVTLFASTVVHAGRHSHPQEEVFAAALEKYFAGKPDQATLDRLQS